MKPALTRFAKFFVLVPPLFLSLGLKAQKFVANADTTVTLPDYKGGITKFYHHVARTFIYPAIARENGIQGRTITVFDVDSAGKIFNIRILNGLTPEIAKEIVRTIELSKNNWLPAKKNGVPVNYQGFILPVALNLEGGRRAESPKNRIPKAYEEYKVALAGKEYANALKLINEIIMNEPTSENFAASSWIKEKLGDMEGARTDIDKALFLNPKKTNEKIKELEASLDH